MLYSGEQFDPNLQMQYLRARYYDQNNGRFNRLDPFGGNHDDPQSLHKYGYAHSDPVMNVDPTGLMSLVSIQGALSIIMTVASNYTMVATDTLKAIRTRFGATKELDAAITALNIILTVEAAVAIFTIGAMLWKVVKLIPNLLKLRPKFITSLLARFK